MVLGVFEGECDEFGYFGGHVGCMRVRFSLEMCWLGCWMRLRAAALLLAGLLTGLPDREVMLEGSTLE